PEEPILSGRTTESYGHWVSGFLDKFIGHRTTDIRHLTSCGLRSFFSHLHRPPVESEVQKTFSITNFGCRASQSEGASIHQELLESHDVESESAYDANVVVVNSCIIKAEAERDVLKMFHCIDSLYCYCTILVILGYVSNV